MYTPGKGAFKSPRKRARQLSQESKVMKDNTRVRVYVRARPLDDDEDDLLAKGPLEFPNKKEIKLVEQRQETIYKFDKVFAPEASNAEVCKAVSEPLLNAVVDGYNGSFMVYGQTGTGKTYTVLSEDGLIPQTIVQLFKRTYGDLEFTYKIYLSYLQIYKDKIYDLLDPSKDMELHLREHPHEGILVDGLKEFEIPDPSEAEKLLEFGRKNLVMAETKMVRLSSRSHSLCVIRVEKFKTMTNETSEVDPGCTDVSEYTRTVLERDEKLWRGKLYLCDLAGSERLKKTGADGNRFQEARYINSSLLELGNVIHALADSRHAHVPFRNSTLTRLLKESLGGNSKASLMICVSSSSKDLNETKCSLNFGQRAMRVTKFSTPNVEIDYKALAEYLTKKLRELESAYHVEKENYKELRRELSQGRRHRSRIPVLQGRPVAPSVSSQAESSLLVDLHTNPLDLIQEGERFVQSRSQLAEQSTTTCDFLYHNTAEASTETTSRHFSVANEGIQVSLSDLDLLRRSICRPDGTKTEYEYYEGETCTAKLFSHDTPDFGQDVPASHGSVNKVTASQTGRSEVNVLRSSCFADANDKKATLYKGEVINGPFETSERRSPYSESRVKGTMGNSSTKDTPDQGEQVDPLNDGVQLRRKSEELTDVTSKRKSANRFSAFLEIIKLRDGGEGAKFREVDVRWHSEADSGSLSSTTSSPRNSQVYRNSYVDAQSTEGSSRNLNNLQEEGPAVITSSAEQASPRVVLRSKKGKGLSRIFRRHSFDESKFRMKRKEKRYSANMDEQPNDINGGQGEPPKKTKSVMFEDYVRNKELVMAALKSLEKEDVTDTSGDHSDHLTTQFVPVDSSASKKEDNLKSSENVNSLDNANFTTLRSDPIKDEPLGLRTEMHGSAARDSCKVQRLKDQRSNPSLEDKMTNKVESHTDFPADENDKLPDRGERIKGVGNGIDAMAITPLSSIILDSEDGTIEVVNKSRKNQGNRLHVRGRGRESFVFESDIPEIDLPSNQHVTQPEQLPCSTNVVQTILAAELETKQTSLYSEPRRDDDMSLPISLSNDVIESLIPVTQDSSRVDNTSKNDSYEQQEPPSFLPKEAIVSSTEVVRMRSSPVEIDFYACADITNVSKENYQSTKTRSESLSQSSKKDIGNEESLISISNGSKNPISPVSPREKIFCSDGIKKEESQAFSTNKISLENGSSKSESLDLRESVWNNEYQLPRVTYQESAPTTICGFGQSFNFTGDESVASEAVSKETLDDITKVQQIPSAPEQQVSSISTPNGVLTVTDCRQRRTQQDVYDKVDGRVNIWDSFDKEMDKVDKVNVRDSFILYDDEKKAFISGKVVETESSSQGTVRLRQDKQQPEVTNGDMKRRSLVMKAILIEEVMQNAKTYTPNDLEAITKRISLLGEDNDDSHTHEPEMEGIDLVMRQESSNDLLELEGHDSAIGSTSISSPPAFALPATDGSFLDFPDYSKELSDSYRDTDSPFDFSEVSDENRNYIHRPGSVHSSLSTDTELELAHAIEESDKLRASLSNVKRQYDDILNQFDSLLGSKSTTERELENTREYLAETMRCKIELEEELEKAREQLALVTAAHKEDDEMDSLKSDGSDVCSVSPVQPESEEEMVSSLSDDENLTCEFVSQTTLTNVTPIDATSPTDYISMSPDMEGKQELESGKLDYDDEVHGSSRLPSKHAQTLPRSGKTKIMEGELDENTSEPHYPLRRRKTEESFKPNLDVMEDMAMLGEAIVEPFPYKAPIVAGHSQISRSQESVEVKALKGEADYQKPSSDGNTEKPNYYSLAAMESYEDEDEVNLDEDQHSVEKVPAELGVDFCSTNSYNTEDALKNAEAIPESPIPSKDKLDLETDEAVSQNTATGQDKLDFKTAHRKKNGRRSRPASKIIEDADPREYRWISKKGLAGNEEKIKRNEQLTLAAIQNAELKKELLLTKLEKIRLEAVLSCVMMRTSGSEVSREYQKLSINSITSSKSTLRSATSATDLTFSAGSEKTSPFHVSSRRLSNSHWPKTRIPGSSRITSPSLTSYEPNTRSSHRESDALSPTSSLFEHSSLLTDSSFSPLTAGESSPSASSVIATSMPLSERTAPCGQDREEQCASKTPKTGGKDYEGNSSILSGDTTDVTSSESRPDLNEEERKEKSLVGCLPFLKRRSTKKRGKKSKPDKSPAHSNDSYHV